MSGVWMADGGLRTMMSGVRVLDDDVLKGMSGLSFLSGSEPDGGDGGDDDGDGDGDGRDGGDGELEGGLEGSGEGGKNRQD